MRRAMHNRPARPVDAKNSGERSTTRQSAIDAPQGQRDGHSGTATPPETANNRHLADVGKMQDYDGLFPAEVIKQTSSAPEPAPIGQAGSRSAADIAA